MTREWIELQRTVHTPGWKVVMQILTELVQQRKDSLHECDDDTRVLRLQHEARGANELKNDFLRRIEIADAETE